MPELPEVETTTKGLRKETVGLKITDVWTDLATKDKRKIDTVSNPKYFTIFKKEVVGKTIVSVERSAKNILINLSPSPTTKNKKTILVHLKMTGHLLYGKYKFNPSLQSPRARGRVGVGSWSPDEHGPLEDPFNRFVHVVFSFSNGKHLAFSDTRKFGKITLYDTDEAHNSRHLQNLGPEPLSKNFTLAKFKERLLRKPNGKIKTVLMDQSVLVGVGNIYSDEVLWYAGVNPERRILKQQNSHARGSHSVLREGRRAGNFAVSEFSGLTDTEIQKIFKAIKETLKKGIDFGGDSMSDYRNIYGLRGKFQLHHEAYRRTGEKCRKKNCDGVIIRKVINSRSAHFCSVHQV